MRRLFPVLLVLLVTSAARAEVYTYTDKDGVVHFTNTPVKGAQTYDPNADALGFGGKPVRYANTPRMWKPKRIHRNTRFDAIIIRAAARYDLPPELVKAVVATESAFNPRAKSRVGACGLMQLMPATAAEMKVRNIWDPLENVMGGSRYLRYLINAFNGDVRLAVAAYNAGPTIVARVGRVPEIPETKSYVKRVLRLYRSYRRSEMLVSTR